MFTIPDVIPLYTGGELYMSVHKHPFTNSAHDYPSNEPLYRIKSESRYDVSPVAKELSNAKRKGWKLLKLGREFAVIEAPNELENTQLVVAIAELASVMYYGELEDQEIFFVIDDNNSWHLVCEQMMHLPDFAKLQKTARSFKTSELVQEHLGYIARTHKGTKNILGLVCASSDNSLSILKSDPVYLGDVSWHLTEKQVPEHIARAVYLARYPEQVPAYTQEWLSADDLFHKMPLWSTEFFFELCKVQPMTFPLTALAPLTDAERATLQKVHEQRRLVLVNDMSVLAVFRPSLSSVLAFKVPKASSKKGIAGWEVLNAQSDEVHTLSTGNNHLRVGSQHLNQVYALEIKIHVVRNSYEVSLMVRDLSAYSSREVEVWTITVKTVEEVKQVLRTLGTINNIQYSVANFQGIVHCHSLRSSLE